MFQDNSEDIQRLSLSIMYFLEKHNWIIVNESDNFIYYNPPASLVTFNGEFLIKLPKYNDSQDFQFLINKIVMKLEMLYSGKYRRSFESFKKRNAITIRKHLNKSEWILPEEASRIPMIGINDIFVPDRFDL